MAGIPILKIGSTTTMTSKMAKAMRMTLVEEVDLLWSLQRMMMHRRFPMKPNNPIRLMSNPLTMNLKRVKSKGCVDPPFIIPSKTSGNNPNNPLT